MLTGYRVVRNNPLPNSHHHLLRLLLRAPGDPHERLEGVRGGENSRWPSDVERKIRAEAKECDESRVGMAEFAVAVVRSTRSWLS
ncbi:hypothetical protein HYDPIDRAFT_116396 [Hydnomerulius pinastri MD-312]|uniref:Unplaced genomic scaffold scaffold_31, whole genome shotgun sequence n=1 Tax=Hydnomerulius pinastri MD-312 TaxID=994086 RepID=A0A0C9WBE0_9AGAM|nr:hypothetical protein HYDPIDRAFT_116396 [Hydnomerulius pinastri MD-312]